MTRRSEVQILPPQPKTSQDLRILAGFFCFTELFWTVKFKRFQLTQILTHTGIELYPRKWTGGGFDSRLHLVGTDLTHRVRGTSSVL